MIPVVYVFAYFLGTLAIALLLPATVAAGFDEAALVPDFLITSALLTFVAGAVMLSLRGRERRLRPAERYLLALLLWIGLPVFGALPLIFALDGVSYLDAYFQTVSGLTTTGANVLPAPELLPRSIVFWLALLQWLGGALTVLMIVLVLAPTGVGGLPEAHARLVEHGGLTEKRRLVLVLRDLMPIYVGATVLCFVLLSFTGLDALDALCLAFASVSTGGFAPRSDVLGDYVSSLGIVFLTLFMLYGATSVLWHRDIVRMRWTRVAAQKESIWIVVFCAFAGLAFAAFYYGSGGDAPLALRDGFFAATSLVTTTGMETRDASFEVLPVTVLLLLVAVGGASFSTAGGIKLFRIGAMFVQAGRELNRLVYPHGVRPARFGSQTYDIQVMKAIWAGFLAFVGLGIAVSLLIASEGVPYEGALLAAYSILSNAGPVYTTNWSDAEIWLPYADMSAGTRFWLCIAMVVGRLEIIAVLGLLVFARRSA